MNYLINPINLFQFLLVQLKEASTRRNRFPGLIFQFLLVQLKVGGVEVPADNEKHFNSFWFN